MVENLGHFAMVATSLVLAWPEQSGLCSSDLVVLQGQGMAATSLGRLHSSRPSTTQVSRPGCRLLAGVEDATAA